MKPHPYKRYNYEEHLETDGPGCEVCGGTLYNLLHWPFLTYDSILTEKD